MSRKGRHFQGITREIRNFSEYSYFRIIVRSNNFVSEGLQILKQVLSGTVKCGNALVGVVVA